MLPAAGVRGVAIIRTAGRYVKRLVSHDARFRVLQHLRVATFSQLLPLSPAGLARFRQGELLNSMVADVDTLDHLYLRVISPLVGALVVIVVNRLAQGTASANGDNRSRPSLNLMICISGTTVVILLWLPEALVQIRHRGH